MVRRTVKDVDHIQIRPGNKHLVRMDLVRGRRRRRVRNKWIFEVEWKVPDHVNREEDTTRGTKEGVRTGVEGTSTGVVNLSEIVS